MPKFVIERDLPGAGAMDQEHWRAVSANSRRVLEEMGPQIQWVESYVTQDKVYCVYIAPSAEAIYTHARRGELPATRVSPVSCVIDPTTADRPARQPTSAAGAPPAAATHALVGAAAK